MSQAESKAVREALSVAFAPDAERAERSTLLEVVGVGGAALDQRHTSRPGKPCASTRGFSIARLDYRPACSPSANVHVLFGYGELYRLFFRWRSTEAKLTRRERIRLLIRLNRLTEANSVEVIADRSSPEHQELKAILHKLASPSKAVGR